MSLILEALRKSEAERRRDRAPDLRLELPPVPRRRAPSRDRRQFQPQAGRAVAPARGFGFAQGFPAQRPPITPAPPARAAPPGPWSRPSVSGCRPRRPPSRLTPPVNP
ncbi:hypothetical protein, partial [Thermomonas haemolytica]|uniref:hypothetical protein n=1 Tax=Thermomonas haemolytica TaxID=141949 RepID=UPI001B87A92C